MSNLSRLALLQGGPCPYQPDEAPEPNCILLLGAPQFGPWFDAWNTALSLAGHTVIFPLRPADASTAWADLIPHVNRVRVDRADLVVVLNVFAYLDADTVNLISYARETGKAVRFAESWRSGNGLSNMHHVAVRLLARRYGVPEGFTSPIDTHRTPPALHTDLLGRGTRRAALTALINHCEGTESVRASRDDRTEVITLARSLLAAYPELLRVEIECDRAAQNSLVANAVATGSVRAAIDDRTVSVRIVIAEKYLHFVNTGFVKDTDAQREAIDHWTRNHTEPCSMLPGMPAHEIMVANFAAIVAAIRLRPRAIEPGLMLVVTRQETCEEKSSGHG